MGEDSEIAEVGRLMKAQRLRRKAHRTERWATKDRKRLTDFLHDVFDVELQSYTEHHYYFRIGNETYNYWPANNRLYRRQWKGAKFMNVDHLIPFLKTQHATDLKTREV